MNLVNLMAIDTNSICGGTLEPVWNMVGLAVQFLLIGIPVILVIFGLMDLGKAVMAGKEDEIKANQKLLIKRIIYTVVAFLLIIIVKGVLGIMEDENASAAVTCLGMIFN